MKSAGKLNTAAPLSKVGVVKSLRLLELVPQRCFGSHREHGAPVAVAFGTSHDDLETVKIEVLDPEVEAFIEAQPGAVEEEPNEAIYPLELSENSGDF